MEAATTPTEQNERRDGDRNVGRIEEIQGVVIEAVFPDELPEINHALLIKRDRAAGDDESISPNLICEVQQHLGDDRVRAVAGGAEGAAPGGRPGVPGGEVPLGRIFTLLGETSERGDAIKDDVERWP